MPNVLSGECTFPFSVPLLRHSLGDESSCALYTGCTKGGKGCVREESNMYSKGQLQPSPPEDPRWENGKQAGSWPDCPLESIARTNPQSRYNTRWTEQRA